MNQQPCASGFVVRRHQASGRHILAPASWGRGEWQRFNGRLFQGLCRVLALWLVAFNLLLFGLEPAIAQTSVVQSRRTGTIYQVQFGAGTYYENWDAACKAVKDGCEAGGEGWQFCYAGGVGKFDDSPSNLGAVCQYVFSMTRGETTYTTPDWKAQGWVIPFLTCTTGWARDPESGLCTNSVPVARNDTCPKSNPVFPSNGAKAQSESDYVFTAAQQSIPLKRGFFSYSRNGFDSGVGWGWMLETWGRRLSVYAGAKELDAVRSAGVDIQFKKTSTGGWAVSPYNSLDLTQTSTGFVLRDRKSGHIETYDSTGRLTKLTLATGLAYTVQYATPSHQSPNSVTASTGQVLTFTYDSSIRLVGIASNGVPVVSFAYSSAKPMLVESATYADARTRAYAYEPELNPRFLEAYSGVPLNKLSIVGRAWGPDDISGVGGSLAWHQDHAGQFNLFSLTGLFDENNARYGTYTYDNAGRIISSKHAGNVDESVFAYGTNSLTTTVTDPLGTLRTYQHVNIDGVLRTQSVSQPGGSGCAASASNTQFDDKANAVLVDDFSGRRTCTAYDLTRNVETVRVEGLDTAQYCSGLLANGAVLPSGARKISTKWHPDWNLPTQVVEPGKRTTFVYNGQPDPFAANAVSSCAPIEAVLPDGTSAAVLCKRVDEATLDSNGSKGFGIAAKAADPSFDKVSLLLHMDASAPTFGFVDSSAQANPVDTFGDASIATAAGRFADGARLDGTGDGLKIPHTPALDVASGDFTAEAWVRFNAVGPVMLILQKRTTNDGAPFRIFHNGTVIRTYGQNAAGSYVFDIVGTTSPAVGTWHHIALTRQGSTFRLFLDGALEGSASSSQVLLTTGAAFQVGSDHDGSSSLNGTIDEVRLTKGLARYTAPFAVPTAAFGNAVTSNAADPIPLDSTVVARTEAWTYNDRGQVLTYNGPRTDVVDTTTYAYYTDTLFTGTDPNAAGHSIGDLQTVTNAAGKVTQYTKYDKHGNLLESVDPNGVVTTQTYDLRQRLLSTSVGGQTTGYSYDPVGQLTRITLPDASWVGYEYDDAHRQKAVLDNRGNRIDYTLDNAGNRTAEAVKDPGGVLKRQLARSIDALGRVQQSTGRN
jgi:YD repeat-containing protein